MYYGHGFVDGEGEAPGESHVVLEVVPDPEVRHHRDPVLVQVFAWTDTRQHQDLRTVYGTGR